MGKVVEQLTGADAVWGFRFGCEGVCSQAEAAKTLGVSVRTIERKVDAGLLRRGKHPDSGVYCICRRSLDLYLSRLEE